MAKPEINNGSESKEPLYPLLSRIDSPADLRKLEISELKQLSAEIRRFLIESLSKNPGHFASSMGAVDFTIALHYVFNTPHDRIVWDVGHQAYGHKLLTGRRDLFHTNRKLNGLSGFPNPDESEYDTFTAGHASNSVSAALGMAVASELKNETPQRNVIAVIGDASISGGLAFEGLNNAANTTNNLLIVLNDNNMSIDRNVGSMHRYLGRLHSSKAYNTFRFKVYNFLKRCHLISERGKGFVMRFNNSLKSLIFKQQNIFEGLNIRYFGPYDGHDIDLMVKVLKDIKDIQGPRILHLRTTKGKGMTAAEKDPSTWHAPGKFDPVSGERNINKNHNADKYQDVFGETLCELAASNQLIVGITAAMPSGTSMNIMQQQFPDRVFDVGISEGHAVTFAAGLAKEGMIPYVAIYSSFLQRAYDNIIHDVAIQQLPVVFCVDRAGIVGEDGATHHGVFDLNYFSSIPNITIAAPRNEIYLRNLLYTAQTGEVSGPIAIRYPRGNGAGTEWRKPFEALKIGKSEKLADGADITVISLGPIAAAVKDAIEKAKDRGIETAHYDAVFLSPIDEEMMETLLEKGKPVITVEDASVKGGLGSAVTEWLNKRGFKEQIVKIGIPSDRFVAQGSVEELHRQCGMDSDTIYDTIIKTARK